MDEANIMARLEHPHIVGVHAAGVTADGRPYIVMTYYPQPNLGIRIRRGPLSTTEVLRVGIQIASAVETAHQSGLLHRDIKPANILVSRFGSPGLTDFGISSHLSDLRDDDETSVSPPWASPEALQGHGVTPASDVFSLAATLWTLLAGHSPFVVAGERNTVHTVSARVTGGIVPPLNRIDVPPSLERLLRASLAVDQATRPSTARQFARGLQTIEQEMRLPVTPMVLPNEGYGTPAPAPQLRPAAVDATTYGTPSGQAQPQVPARVPFSPGPTIADSPTRQMPVIPLPAPKLSAATPRPSRRWVKPVAMALPVALAVAVAAVVVPQFLAQSTAAPALVASVSATAVARVSTSAPATTTAPATTKATTTAPAPPPPPPQVTYTLHNGVGFVLPPGWRLLTEYPDAWGAAFTNGQSGVWVHLYVWKTGPGYATNALDACQRSIRDIVDDPASYDATTFTWSSPRDRSQPNRP